MWNLIAWILVCVSVLTIIFIIIRKFPALSILNVDNIPGKKEAKFKEQIMKQRLERDFSGLALNLNRKRRYLGKITSSFLKDHYQRLLKLKNDLKRYKKISFREKREKIDVLLIKAEEAISQEDYQGAENYLIEVISLDPKKVRAFLELGESYRLRKSFKEAKETLEHALKLAQQLKRDPELLTGIVVSEIQFSLACVCEEGEFYDEAIEYGRQALDAEPNNPRYLDLILDLSIMKKDKKLALETWEKLSLANPENQKLSELKEKIDKIIDE
jgi:tetratricopeptide (TPR) repeat protein